MTECDPVDEPQATKEAGAMTLELADSLRRVEHLQAKLAELAVLLDGHPSARSPVH